jgi:hypothetical protein
MDKASLNKLHETFYRYIKKKALSFEGRPNKELRAYQKTQEKLFCSPYQLSSEEELSHQILNSQVVYVADFHTFDQYAKNYKRILRQLLENGKEVVVALEMMTCENQASVSAFCQGYITELELLETVNYSETWRFPWSHYRDIFQIAKQEKLEVLALNSIGSLKERDQFAAEVLSRKLQEQRENKDLVILVQFGELHILKPFIPHYVKKKFEDVKQTIIHQNSDVIYWDLLKKIKIRSLTPVFTTTF